MNNYEYVIASLPNLTPDMKFPDEESAKHITEFIKKNCSKKDNILIDILLEGLDENKLDKEFYEKALKSKNKFLRIYWETDLNIRNTKVRFINRALEREPEKDIFLKPEKRAEYQNELNDIFSDDNLLVREHRIDDFMWKTIDKAVLFNYFNITVILAFIAKLHIVVRWTVLDEKTGRKLFRNLVEEIRGTFKGVPDEL